MQAFELREHLHFYQHSLGQKVVMASLVGLNGSSYRQPGVRMLIAKDGTMSGALSGGCVEQEIVASAYSVFESGISKVISYDGRYRLGCEGLLYILIEPFEITPDAILILLSSLETRQPIHIQSFYKKGTTITGAFYSIITIDDNSKPIQLNHLKHSQKEELIVFEQTVQPGHQLIIIGAEHDAQKLNANAALLGWDVVILASAKDPRTVADFPGAKQVIATQPETFDYSIIDTRTSVVLMTHNYAYDLKYLLRLKELHIAYIGILGSKKRKSNLENDLLEHAPDIEIEFLDTLHSPAGLNIGAVTPQEIALSIIAEIMQIKKQEEATIKTPTIKSSLS